MNNEAITNNRLTYMDVAKGFGILCVIAGHMGNETINTRGASLFQNSVSYELE